MSSLLISYMFIPHSLCGLIIYIEIYLLPRVHIRLNRRSIYSKRYDNIALSLVTHIRFDFIKSRLKNLERFLIKAKHDIRLKGIYRLDIDRLLILSIDDEVFLRFASCEFCSAFDMRNFKPLALRGVTIRFCLDDLGPAVVDLRSEAVLLELCDEEGVLKRLSRTLTFVTIVDSFKSSELLES
ncbi:hypothetical protein FF38_07114 [Lucilia cuprina]|uniref:Uncharacterized protein n=1 Tax=Lucilia cuprina TaxID=7375 RepID=A0A0L0CIU2_LUCCU|nr:hypothetical protein FF38_07114 [Lucilia cuprina]